MATAESKFMDVISDRTDVLKILPEAAAELCTALFRNSPAGIYITRDGKFIYTNIEFRRVTGYSQDELSGKDYQRIINPRYRQMPKQNIAFLLEEDTDTGHEFKITTRDGKKKWISEKITYFKYGGNWLTLGHWLDISEHHSVEKAWREAERRFQSAFEDLATGLTIIGTDGIFLKVNKSFCDMIGYEEKDILESRFDEVLCPDDREACGDIMALFLSLEKPDRPFQMRLQSRDGRLVWVAVNISLIGDSEDGPTYFIVNFQDITEQKRIEAGLKEEESLYRSLVDLSLEPVAVADLDGHLTHVSRRFITLLGYESGKDLLVKNISSLIEGPEAELIQSKIMDIMRNGSPGRIGCSLIKRDGAAIPVSMDISWINNERGGPLCIVIHVRGKADDKQAEVEAPVLPDEKPDDRQAAAAVQSEQQAAPAIAAALENTSTAFILINEDTTIAAVNSAFEKLSGFPRSEIEGKKSWIEFVALQDRARLKRYYLMRRLDPGSAPDTYKFNLVDREGNSKEVIVYLSAVPGMNQQTATLFDLALYNKPVGEEKKDMKHNDYGLDVSKNIKSMVWLLDLGLKVIWVNPFEQSLRGFSKEARLSLPLDRQVAPDSLQRAIQLYEQEMEIEKSGKADPHRTRTMEIELYREDGSTYWSEIVFSLVRNEQGEPIAVLCEGREITDRKAAEERAEKSLAMLERTVLGVIDAMAKVVELKDPYTSGHQERVARLARAIAEEMGLPEELAQGIEFTAKIHDIGKVYVPMEILSKPGILTAIERQIIQTHAAGSYDILKSIDFPWPVAESAYQHHERLDGSGYPRHLKENEIILEAKILMVADVVEAMGSHRPYRPSRGIDAALDEISKNGGTLYDTTVGDACIRLFREKGFSLEEPNSVP
ncbi:MAG: PAS domain S-box protein [Dehalococcoidia bacterium]